MGYEIRLHVVSLHGGYGERPRTGSELAMVELGKCNYDGPLREFVDAGTKEPEPNTTPDFALYVRPIDRLREAAEFIRELNSEDESPYDSKWVENLADDLENGMISTDMYNNYLGMFGLKETIEALENETINSPDNSNVKWALGLFKSILETYPPGYVEDRIRVISYGH